MAATPPLDDEPLEFIDTPPAPGSGREDEIELCAHAHHKNSPRTQPSLRAQHAFSRVRSDPPLGSVPDFTASIPMLRGVGERWKKGGGSAALISILKDQGNRTAFKLLVRTTSAMFGLPLLVFFLAHSFVLDQLFTFKSPGDKGLWSGARCTQPRAQKASLLAPSRTRARGGARRRLRPLHSSDCHHRLPGGRVQRASGAHRRRRRPEEEGQVSTAGFGSCRLLEAVWPMCFGMDLRTDERTLPLRSSDSSDGASAPLANSYNELWSFQ